MATRWAVATGNWNTTDTWSATSGGSAGASVPATGDHARIEGSYTVTLPADTTCGSVRLDGSGTLAGAGYTLTLDSSGEGQTFDNDGVISGTLNVSVTGGSGKTFDGTNTGNINNLIINNSGQTLTLGAALTLGGNLTITAGTLDTNSSSNFALTVSGAITVASGAVLTCNASTINNGSASITAPDIVWAGTINLMTCTFNYYNGGSSNFNLASCTLGSNTSTVNIIGRQAFAGRDTDLEAGSGTLHHLALSQTGSLACVFNLYGNTPIGGDLTIGSGTTLSTSGGSAGDNKSLTVTGDVSVTGTLTGNASAISMGSLTIASGGTYSATSGTTTLTADDGASPKYCFKNAGTFTPNAGLVMVESPNTYVLMEGGGIHDLTIAAETHNTAGIYWNTNPFVITGVLTIEALGYFAPWAGGHGLTVTEDVSVTGILGSGSTGAYSFGSLTIASGGTYNATSDTTTITGGGANGDSATALHGEGTFTHNNGTLIFDACERRIPLGGTFYNVTLNGEQASDGLYSYASTLLPQGIMPDGTTGAGYISILGTLQINNDEFRPYEVTKMYIHNLIIGDGTGSANTAKFDMAEADVFDGTIFVDNVTIHSDGQFLFGDGDETSSTVGSSALNIYGAFRNLGGNVTIE